MAKVLTSVNVAWIDELLDALSAFDRKPHGEISYTVDLDEDIHNRVYISFTWISLPNARDFWKSDEAKTHIKNWRSVTEPNFTFLRTLPTDRF